MNEAEQTCAFIALLGRANVGKTSLLSRLTGRKIGIISDKPQTTRTRAMGALHRGGTELVFVDTPGLLEPKNRLGEQMRRATEQAFTDADAALLVTDAKPKFRANPGYPTAPERKLVEKIGRAGIPTVLAVNKIDLIPHKTDLLPVLTAWNDLADFSAIVPVSAKTGDGTEELIGELSRFAKPSPHFFPNGAVTDLSDQTVAAELIREKILLLLREEVPHGVAVETETFRVRPAAGGGSLLEIGAVIWCEKENHKGILIGKQGEMLKQIGTAARADIERQFGEKADLKLRVKVKRNWRDDPAAIRRFGLDFRA